MAKRERTLPRHVWVVIDRDDELWAVMRTRREAASDAKWMWKYPSCGPRVVKYTLTESK